MFERLVPSRYYQVPFVTENKEPGWLRRFLASVLGRKNQAG
jgi:hypothetical protein